MGDKMKPVEFPEANRNLTKPKGMTDKECGPLPVLTDHKACCSKWKLTLMERIRLLIRGHLWLVVCSGETQPPVSLGLEKPFTRPPKPRPKPKRRTIAIMVSLIVGAWILSTLLPEPEPGPMPNDLQGEEYTHAAAALYGATDLED